jgi:hypothetical protein
MQAPASFKIESVMESGATESLERLTKLVKEN